MPKISRRAMLAAAGVAAPALLNSRFATAAAADFPAKNIQFIVPYAPGGGFDVYVRFIAPVMEKYLPRRANIVPINIAAGAGSRGVAQLYRARPDGYTIGVLNVPGMFILQQQQGTAAYDLGRFAWVGAMGEGERYVICVGADSPIMTYADLQALSRMRPVKFSVTGPEGTAYLATVIGTELLGIDKQLITGYRGSADYLVAAVRGDSDAVVAAIPTAMRFVRGGRVRPLASFELQSGIPGIPDATALGQPDLDRISVERLVAAPPGTPAGIQNILSMALAKALADPTVVAWASENDLIMKPKTPQQAAATLAEQRAFFERWQSVLDAG